MNNQISSRYLELLILLSDCERGAGLSWSLNKMNELRGEITAENNAPLFQHLLFYKLLTKFSFGELELKPYTSQQDSQFRKAFQSMNAYLEVDDPYLTGAAPNIFKFFRRMAYQQFWLQMPSFRMDIEIARQLILFGNFNNMFNILSDGLGIQEYLELCFSLFALVREPGKNHILVSNWNTVSAGYASGTIEKFLNCISKSPSELGSFLSTLPIIGIETQRYEMSPLRYFPLVRHASGFYIFSQRLLNYYIHNNLYDRLKIERNREFLGHFGQQYERYVERLLIEFQIDYKTEAWYLNKHSEQFGRSGKCVDFILPFRDAIILIEAKATEPSTSVGTQPTEDTLLQVLKDSIIKAVTQSFTVAHTLNQHPNWLGYETLPPIYVVIPTYKEMYLGAGHQMWDEFLQRAIEEKLCDTDVPMTEIPAANIFVMTIGDLEKLIFSSSSNGGNLPNRFQKYRAWNTGTAEQSMFTFSMVIDKEIGKIGLQNFTVPFLETEYNRFCESIKARFQDDLPI